MPVHRNRLSDFLRNNGPVVRVEVSNAKGSSPRDPGAEMFVAENALWGTIGGGRLEFLAIEDARRMLRDGVLNLHTDVPLGPEIGQCCGGHVSLALSRMRGADRSDATLKETNQLAQLPHVYVMGAGHVGRALANLFQHLPVKCIVVDPRAEEIALCAADVETRVSAIPEIDILKAPSNSAFVILTHDHGLDFLLSLAALERGDAAYVGMIGSATKRAKFNKWSRKHNGEQPTENLICPIGASDSRDKRPSVIAAFVAAEVIAELTSETVATAPFGANQLSEMGNIIDPAESCA